MDIYEHCLCLTFDVSLILIYSMSNVYTILMGGQWPPSPREWSYFDSATSVLYLYIYICIALIFRGLFHTPSINISCNLRCPVLSDSEFLIGTRKLLCQFSEDILNKSLAAMPQPRNFMKHWFAIEVCGAVALAQTTRPLIHAVVQAIPMWASYWNQSRFLCLTIQIVTPLSEWPSLGQAGTYFVFPKVPPVSPS